MNDSLHFQIAGIPLTIQGEATISLLKQINGFQPFLTQEVSGTPAYTYLTNLPVGTLPAASTLPPDKIKLLHQFDFEDIDCYFYLVPDENSYRFEMIQQGGKHPFTLLYHPGSDTLQATPTESAIQLRFALWMSYNLIAAASLRFAIHSSVIIYNHAAYLFLGESGTGKSTHTRLWREHLPDSFLLNDDSPIIRYDDACRTTRVYGSPWSGKTPCYKNADYPVAAIIRLSQAPHNQLRKLSQLESIGALLPSCPPSFSYDTHLQYCILDTLSGILLTTPIYHLECLPNSAAVETVLQGIQSGQSPFRL